MMVVCILRRRALKAAEMAISNPLIDDYTLKGAKGLLVNITGGKDLKLFEVDEAVNKVRAEVDPEAELIIGAITDSDLDGKMRVSIVATSLDGQQPEAKSVINMVHRIQNRNPGYSDFSNMGTASFTFSNQSSNPVTHGANALKIDSEIVEEQKNLMAGNVSQEMNVSSNMETQNIVEESSKLDEETSFTSEALNNIEQPDESLDTHSNGLEEFGVDMNEPDLFNTSESNEKPDALLLEDEHDEDDLEIPAFLRRQKN